MAHSIINALRAVSPLLQASRGRHFHPIYLPRVGAAVPLSLWWRMLAIRSRLWHNHVNCESAERRVCKTWRSVAYPRQNSAGVGFIAWLRRDPRLVLHWRKVIGWHEEVQVFAPDVSRFQHYC